MKMRAMVVSDTTEERPNKEGKPVKYRTLSVIDQSDDGATLEAMAKVGISPDDSRAGKSLAGAVVTLSIRNIQDDWRGLSFRADLVSVDGAMTFVPKSGK